MFKKTLLSLMAAVVLGLGFAGCERGPGEKAGRQIDRAGERTRDTIEDTGDRIRESTERK
jgi:hypothetical protein